MLDRFALAVALALLAASAQAQSELPPPVVAEPVSGVVKAMGPDQMVLTTAKGEVKVLVKPETRVVVSKATSASEIKTGAYLGTSNVTGPTGGEATEVHLMEDGNNVHYTMDADKHLMMTNGHVKSVETTAKGQEMDVDYGAGVRHVVVPSTIPVTRMVDTPISSVKVGTSVKAYVRSPKDGKPFASYILIDPK